MASPALRSRTGTLLGFAGLLASPRARETLGFCLLVVLHVLPIWAFSPFSTQDGPAHIYNALALLHRTRGPFSLFYQVNRTLQSANWPLHLTLGVLASVFSPVVGEKILQASYVVVFVFAFRHALHRIAPRAPRAMSWAVFPFVYSYSFHMGFYAYCFGTALFLVGLGSWATWRARPGKRRGVRFAALLVVLFLVHPLPLVLLVVVPPVELGFRAALALRRARRRRDWRDAVRRAALARLVRLSLWSAPALLLHVISSRGRAGQLEWLPVLRSAVGFFVLSSLSSHDVREFVGSVSVAILVWGSGAFLLIGRRSRRWEPRDSWLAAALALSVAVVLFPNQVSGGSFIKLRIQMLPYLAVLLWIGIEAKRRQTWSWLARALALASVLMIGVRFPAYRKLSREVTEYGTAVAAIAPGSSVLPVTIGTPSNSLRVDVLKHAVDRFSAERGILDLGNYQVLESYFPLHARREFESGLWHAYPLMTHCNHRAWAQLPLVPDYVILTVRQAVASAVAGRSEDARKEIACELRRGTPPYPEVARALGGALRVYRLK